MPLPASRSQIQRRTELYLRALWGSGYRLSFTATPAADHAVISYLQQNVIYLPLQINHPLASHYHRAAAVHAALHDIFHTVPYEIADLNLMQRSLVNLIEDLRVELLAIRQFPGLRSLWLNFHPPANSRQNSQTDNAQDLLLRLSRSVLDPHSHDPHLWVTKARQLLLDPHYDLQNGELSLQTGLQLANDLGQMRLPLNSGRYEQAVIYRDDNRCLWQQTQEHHDSQPLAESQQSATPHNNYLRESQHGTELALAPLQSASAEGFWLRQNDAACFTFNQPLVTTPSATLRYPEWDYRTHVLKSDWCTVTQSVAAAGTDAGIASVFRQHKFTRNRLRQIARQLQTVKRQRVRKLEDGDEVDLEPFITAQIALRCSQTPDPRVFMQQHNRYHKSLAVSLLMDLSESTNATVNGTDLTLAQLMRDAVLLLADTLDTSGELFALHGFSSSSRHDVSLVQYKGFAETFAETKNRLATIHGQHSTRLGTAIRHCGAELNRQPATKKLLLVITDGEPSDIDVYDPAYLQHDSWQAVSSLHSLDIKTFCLNLDAGAADTMTHIFGRGHFESLDDLRRLPQLLSQIYLKYLRH